MVSEAKKTFWRLSKTLTLGLSLLVTSSHAQTSVYQLLLEGEFAAAANNKALASEQFNKAAVLTQQDPIFEKALIYALDAKNDQQSLAVVKAWVQSQPNNISARFYLAHLAIKLGELDVGVDALSQLLLQQPSARLDRILVGVNLQDAEHRAAVLAKITPLAKRGNPSLMLIAAGLLIQQEGHAEALMFLDAILAKKPNNTTAIKLKHDVLEKTQDGSSACMWLRQYNAKHNLSSLGLTEIQCLQKQGDSFQAILLTRHYLSLQPKNAQLWRQYMQLNRVVGDTAEMTFALNKMCEFAETQSEGYWQLGQQAELRRDVNSAKRFYTLASIKQSMSDAEKRLAEYRLSIGELSVIKEIQQQYQSAKEPQRLFFHRIYASLLYKHGDVGAAQSEYNRMLTEYSANSDALEAIVSDLPEGDLTDTKIAYASALHKTAPNNPSYLYIKAQSAYFTNTNTASAIDAMEQVVELEPTNPVYWSALAKMYWTQGDKTLACSAWNKVWEIGEKYDVISLDSYALWLNNCK